MRFTGRTKRGIWGAVAILICGSLLSAPAWSQDSAVSQAKALSRAFRQAANAARPAVVTVLSTIDLAKAENIPPQLRQLLPRNGGSLKNSQVGSGVVIDSEGVILTNNHVVEGATEVKIRFSNGKEVVADKIIRDPASDLAVVKVPARTPLRAAKLGNSTLLDIGDWVIAIGSPFELEATVSAGIISGKGRGIRKIRRGQLLQTDAAINPGNSGGPLVNLDGEVVGINTAIATSSGGYQGIGFAIPVNRAKWVAKELLAHGKVRRAYLGISISDIDASLGNQLGFPPRHGVWVRSVARGGPADVGGLEEGDVILEFASRRVRSMRDLQDAVEQKPIGSAQVVKVQRGEQVRRLRVTLKSFDDIARTERERTPTRR